MKRRRRKNGNVQRGVVEKGRGVDDVGVELHVPAEWAERAAEGAEIEG